MIRTRIKGDLWTIKVVTDLTSKHENGGEFGALTIPSEKCIYLLPTHRDMVTLKHELWHAYTSYLYLEDTSGISVNDLEEISAGMFAADAEKMLRQARMIHKKLNVGNP